MELSIPRSEIAGFAEKLGTPEYEASDRAYKDAVSLIVQRVFGEESRQSVEFSGRVADFFAGTLDLEAIGLSAEERARIDVSTKPL